MNPLTPISILAQQVRNTTLGLLQSADPRRLTWAPPGTSNHLLWHAGHALWVVDLLAIEPVVGKSELPTGWPETFGSNCRPVNKTTDWPPAEEVSQLLADQLARFQQMLRTHAEVIQSNVERMSPANGWPLLPGIIHGWHDEARHQGEMYLLLKLMRSGG